jgi:hypothetical protein
MDGRRVAKFAKITPILLSKYNMEHTLIMVIKKASGI